MKLRHIPALLLTPLFALSACGPATTPVDCGGGESFESGSETFCVYRSAITEEGFSCPADLSVSKRLGALVVCSSGDVPQDVLDGIPGRFPDEDLPTGDCANVLCDVDELCSEGTCSTPSDEEACLSECGAGCPAPEFQPCASDGRTYCNECTITCKGLTVADDASTCSQQAEEECIAACGDGCPAPEFQICASDGERYCNDCVVGCKGLTTAEDASSCDG